MGDALLNGCEPLDWELPAIERARQHERGLALELPAGVLTGVREPAAAGPGSGLLPAQGVP